MTTIPIINNTDLTDLKKYVSENKYTDVTTSILNGEYHVSWDTHETFIIKMGNFTTQERNNIVAWIKSFDGTKHNLIFGKDKTPYITSCEVTESHVELYQETPEGLKTIVRPFQYFILSHKQFNNSWTELDGDLHYKYIKYFDTKSEFHLTKNRLNREDIWCVSDPREQAMITQGFTYFKELHVKDVSILSFDLETTTLELNKDSKILIIANTYRKGDVYIRKLFSEDEYDNQGDMIDDWCDWVREVNPSIMTGFNIYSFDLPYLDFIASNNGTSLALGRNGDNIKFNSRESDIRITGGMKYKYHKCYIYGREVVDMMFTAYHYDIGKNYEKYALKEIIKQEGLAREGRQYYETENIGRDWADVSKRSTIKEYAMDDTDEVIKLWDLQMPSYFYMNQNVPKSCQAINYSATGSIINSLLMRSYLQKGHSVPKADEKYKYKGAISDGNPGIYDNVLKIDIKSLYPSLMLQYKIFPYKKDPHNAFLTMLEYFTKQRLLDKQKAEETGSEYYLSLSESRKIFINSAYGLLGAPGLNFNDMKAADEVTAKGRDVLKKSIYWATGQIYQEKEDTEEEEDVETA